VRKADLRCRVDVQANCAPSTVEILWTLRKGKGNNPDNTPCLNVLATSRLTKVLTALILGACFAHTLHLYVEERTTFKEDGVFTGDSDTSVSIPRIGLGTGRLKGKKAYRTTLRALELGYRMIDTAASYENEVQIGNAIRDSGIPRKEIFVISKCGAHACSLSAGETRKTLNKSMTDLGLDYIDLYLIHMPCESGLGDSNILRARIVPGQLKQMCRSKTPDYESTAARRRQQVWKELGELKRQKLLRNIGVSNFQVNHLRELCNSEVGCPLVNQVEWHPRWHDEQLKSMMDKNKITLIAYAPTGPANDLKLMHMTQSDNFNITTSAASLSWALRRGVSIIPRATSEIHLKENLFVTEQLISFETAQQIDSLQNESQTCLYCHHFHCYD